ncbi:hypothetical protein DYH55_08665 [Methylovirgula sp. 4M-Z18]|nr:hypothetical protein DYH55_08665 [Methylovirgula sp. 4M-Z18]
MCDRRRLDLRRGRDGRRRHRGHQRRRQGKARRPALRHNRDRRGLPAQQRPEGAAAANQNGSQCKQRGIEVILEMLPVLFSGLHLRHRSLEIIARGKHFTFRFLTCPFRLLAGRLLGFQPGLGFRARLGFRFGFRAQFALDADRVVPGLRRSLGLGINLLATRRWRLRRRHHDWRGRRRWRNRHGCSRRG